MAISLADAVRFAGAAASGAMRHAVERGPSPADVTAMVCRFYGRALVDSQFGASCPIGAVAQEAYDDPMLRETVDDVFADWRTILIDALVADGHPRADAAELAELCVAGLEGALMLARIAQGPDPLDRVERRLVALLSRAAG